MWWSVFISSIFHLIRDFADAAVVSRNCGFKVPLRNPLPKYWVEVLGKTLYEVKMKFREIAGQDEI
jgi:hypothetical protein